ncbi:hypothetical protein KFK09_000613 [Dendrobium nobile]|uniref:CCHC-type domain-containing protein n=1 Tax=Dendrobium nobile TaxID=94219 RepID=A0A8T3CF99_DENNO|nr:hypothetical protein KFK09_000613 [Dendrobium nobile]
MDPKIEAVRHNIAKLDRALVAKVLGRRIAFPHLLSELKRRWYQFRDFEIVTTAPNSFICLFASPEARDAVLMSGPWIIASNIVGMDKWTPNSSPSSLQGMHSPIWIRLPQLPLIYWDADNINRIANMLGDPLWMDSHTSSWGKSSYARICVRIDISQRLLPGIWINGIHGRFFQRVKYERLTNFCFECGYIGHTSGSCMLKKPSSALAAPSTQAPQPVESSHGGHVMPKQLNGPPLLAGTDSSNSEEPEDSSFGEWNLIMRRRKGKARTNNSQANNAQVTRAEASPPIRSSSEGMHQLEEILNRIVHSKNSSHKEPRITFSAEKMIRDPTSKTVNLSKRQQRAPKTFLEKQLIHLGLIATLPRKRWKNLQDDTGGDFVPFDEQ